MFAARRLNRDGKIAADSDPIGGLAGGRNLASPVSRPSGSLKSLPKARASGRPRMTSTDAAAMAVIVPAAAW